MIECFRVTDYLLATKVLEECWEEIAEDGAEFKIPDIVNGVWIGMMVNEEFSGAFSIYAKGAVLYEAHALIVENKKHSVAMAKSAYGWIIKELPHVRKLITNVPSFNEKALRFCKSIGMERQGMNSEAFLKNGKTYPVIQYGIEKGRMEELCLTED